MNTPAHAPVYAVVSKRQDGHRRIVGEYAEPSEALGAAKLLRWAGDPAEVVVLTRLHDDLFEGAD